MTILEVENLDFYFGKQQVLKQVSFSLEKGDIAGLIGNNGAGKTTLMKVISGILPGAQHAVNLKTTSVGALIEAPALYPQLTVRENLHFYCKLYDRDKAIIDTYKEDLEVSAYLNKKASKLSLGMKQRVGLFIALIASDEFILLDEPTNGLDPSGIHNLLTLIKTLSHKHGLTFIISSHILANLDQVCNKSFLLQDGRLHQVDGRQTARYKIYTEDLSLKDLMAIFEKYDLSFERKGYDLLVSDLRGVTQVMEAIGVAFDYGKEGLSEVLFHEN